MGVEWTTSEWLIIQTLWKERERRIGCSDAPITACQAAAKRCGVTPARVREVSRRYQIQRRRDKLNV